MGRPESQQPRRNFVPGEPSEGSDGRRAARAAVCGGAATPTDDVLLPSMANELDRAGVATSALSSTNLRAAAWPP
jgi:hypothetical protein